MSNISRSEIAAMSKEDRAKFMQKNWKLIKEACDKAGGDTIEALKAMKPSLYGIGGTSVGGTSSAKWKTLTDKFEKIGDKQSELDLFKDMKIGEKEAHLLIKNALKAVEPAQRKWITFKGDTYTLSGIGANPPANFTGITVDFSDKKKDDKKEEVKAQTPSTAPSGFDKK